MTLPPHRIGYQGQKYEARSKGYPEEGWSSVGWSNSLLSVEIMVNAMLKHPDCTEARIINLHKDKV